MSARSPRPGEPDFRLIAETEVWKGVIVSVSRLDVADPEGKIFDRDVVRHPGAVAVVPVHEDRTVVLVRQYRPGVNAFVLELPAGTCDVEGEALEETARRELQEEAGLEAKVIEELAVIYNSPGYCDERTAIYMARGLEDCPPAPAGVEERWMTVERISLESVEDLMASGELFDAKTVIGLLLARQALVGPEVGPA